MLIPLPAKSHRRRLRLKPAPSAPPAAALTLVSASFNPDSPGIVLTFDRAINIDAIAPDQFHVNDDVFTGSLFVGDPDGAGVGGATMSLIMDVAGVASGGQVVLSVGAANGIVAVDDGGTWAGVTDLALPFA
jgi:hypothetical protein